MGWRETNGGSITEMERWLLERFPKARWETPTEGLGVLRHHVRLPGAGGPLPPGHLFLDLETLGFVGRPLFLVGMLIPSEGREADLVQLLARDYGGEEEALRLFATDYAPAPTWVTFNGKSFDVPCLRLRYAFYRMPKPAPREHLDLLHVARRQFRGVFPDCRLQTLERRVCGRWRAGDLGGREVPDAYHRWVRDGDPYWLEPILRHNRDDLITLAELYLALALPEEEEQP